MKKNDDQAAWLQSIKLGTVFGLIGVVLVMLIGHNQSQYMIKIQPMKMAAAEALWDSQDPAAMSLFTIGNEKKREDVFAVKIPGLLSFLAYNRFSGEVKGINDVQKEYEMTYGPGNYVPPVAISYWTFRIMIGAGLVMLLLVVVLLSAIFRNKLEFKPLTLKIIMWAIALPYLANTTGWIFTEMARQPWIVFGLMRTEHAVSPTVSAGSVLFSLVLFTLLYGVLMVADIYLLQKHAKAGTTLLNLHD
jgi:cytochrome d ubiquinol oxidase subunit I